MLTPVHFNVRVQHCLITTLISSHLICRILTIQPCEKFQLITNIPFRSSLNYAVKFSLLCQFVSVSGHPVVLTTLQQSLVLSVHVATVEARNPLQLNLVQSEQPSAAANCGFDKTEHKKKHKITAGPRVFRKNAKC